MQAYSETFLYFKTKKDFENDLVIIRILGEVRASK